MSACAAGWKRKIGQGNAHQTSQGARYRAKRGLARAKPQKQLRTPRRRPFYQTATEHGVKNERAPWKMLKSEQAAQQHLHR
eukprot:1355139-Rhodomonas_salina.1